MITSGSEMVKTNSFMQSTHMVMKKTELHTYCCGKVDHRINLLMSPQIHGNMFHLAKPEKRKAKLKI